MRKNKIKENFHRLIDEFNDISILENYYLSLNDYHHQKEKSDILDELTPYQRQRLKESLKQAEEGKVVSDAIVRAKIKKWFRK